MTGSAASSEATLVDVLPNHRFDEAALASFLERNLPGSGGSLVIRQFQGGQSNPTYHIKSDEKAYVLRKQPAGPLLPGAHAIDREYEIQSKLAGHGIPLAEMHLLCMDDQVIGQSFYLMEHVEGRIFADRLLPDVSPEDRRQIYLRMIDVLARLHDVDIDKAGLGTFGKRGEFVKRQISRWQRAYDKTKVADNVAMDAMIDWLTRNMPSDDEETIVHGDFRIGNMIVHPQRPEIVAVLDWELATIGHPLSDLAYTCMAHNLPSITKRGFADLNFRDLGIPEQRELIERYAKARGLDDVPHWDYFVVLSIFRLASILAGVYRRALDGNAADTRAKEADTIFRMLAEEGQKIIQSLP